jgi:hypothetical protein
MNNTTTKRNLALAAVFMAATLVVGTFAVTTTTIATTGQSAYAYSQKKKGGGEDNGKGNGNGNTVTIEECKNRDSASGFDTAVDQECENLICTHPGENATCSQEGVVTPTSTPTPKPTTTTLLVKKVCERFLRPLPQPPCILFPGLEFSIQITGNNGNNAQPSTFILAPDTSGSDQQLVTLDPGTFTIVENAAFGSGTTFSGDCKQIFAPGIRAGTVTISVGQHLTCTITNTIIED